VSGGGGIMRPVLARMLSEATLGAGVRVRLGQRHTMLTQTDAQVTVTFSNGDVGRYELVVGADLDDRAVRADLKHGGRCTPWLRTPGRGSVPYGSNLGSPARSA
jgi:hypothetical protein